MHRWQSSWGQLRKIDFLWGLTGLLERFLGGHTGLFGGHTGLLGDHAGLFGDLTGLLRGLTGLFGRFLRELAGEAGELAGGVQRDLRSVACCGCCS
jgi:hypothetical protein